MMEDKEYTIKPQNGCSIVFFITSNYYISFRSDSRPVRPWKFRVCGDWCW